MTCIIIWFIDENPSEFSLAIMHLVPNFLCQHLYSKTIRVWLDRCQAELEQSNIE